jgi:hypothetical protein
MSKKISLKKIYKDNKLSLEPFCWSCFKKSKTIYKSNVLCKKCKKIIKNKGL